MTVEELKRKASSHYAGMIREILSGTNPFPIRLGYKRPSRSQNPAEFLRVKEMLRSQSKQMVGFGPSIGFEEVNTRRFAKALIPGTILFDTFEDLTRYIDKEQEALRILAHAAIVTNEYPAARAWVAKRWRVLIDGDQEHWSGIVEAVRFFQQNPKPWIYPREVSLSRGTKFLENNYALIIDLLEHTSPLTLNTHYESWQDRLGLRSASCFIEGRFLDQKTVPALPRHLMISTEEWNRALEGSVSTFLIVENRTTFLTLPPTSNCIALLGKGYAVARLEEIKALATSKVFYWGDTDQHGFEILALLRARVPQVQSVLMGLLILKRFPKLVQIETVDPTLPTEFVQTHLDASEQEVWRLCADSHTRVEQEHLPLAFVNEVLSGRLNH
ncbi:MAG: hypothetical protein H0X66_09510 [Verrucomicrobia bacterium]|nr:hypothetical protein [Verrucomicrobiota bacterium]